jgi:uncharacterized protein
MTEHPNAALARHAYQAFARADLQTIRALFAETAQWESAGRNWLVGRYTGPGAIIAFLQAVFAYSEGTYRTDVHDILANDERAVVLQRSRAKRSDGKTLDTNAAVVLDITGGKVSSVRAWPWDLYAEDAFYGTQPPSGMARPPQN